ncbi:MAG TPA: hypothetical protein VFH35_12870, partial [Ramlibacter sp.]|nr:hypothetical protein [Ramlibacter sp.]
MKKAALLTPVRHAAVTLKAAQCTGAGGTGLCHARHFQRQGATMFFAPTLHRRAYAPAARA